MDDEDRMPYTNPSRFYNKPEKKKDENEEQKIKILYDIFQLSV
jgi:hypothetical protein